MFRRKGVRMKSHLYLFVVVLLGVILLGASVVTLSLISEDVPEYKIVLLPLEINQSHNEVDYLKLAFPLTMASRLSESQQLHIVSAEDSQEIHNQYKDHSQGYQRIAEHYQADVVIGGTLFKFPQRFEIQLTCYFSEPQTFDTISEYGLYPQDFYIIQRNAINRMITNLEWGLDLAQFRQDCGKYYRSLLILIDESGSMKDDGKIDMAKQSCEEILDRVNPDNTEVALMTFSSAGCTGNVTRIVHPFSNNITALKSAVSSIRANSGTPLSRGIEQAILYMEQNHQGRIGHIVVIGDGEDDCANMSMAEKAINQSVLHISLDTVGLNLEKDSAEELDLRRIAENLGGSYYSVFTNSMQNTQESELEAFLQDPDIQETPSTAINEPIIFLGH